MVTDLSIDSVFRKSLREFFRYAPFYIITSLAVSLICTILMYVGIHFLPEEFLQFLSVNTENYSLLFSRLPYPGFILMILLFGTVIILSTLSSYLIWMYHAFTIKRTQNPPRMTFVDMCKNHVFFKGLITLILYLKILMISSLGIIIPLTLILSKFNLLLTPIGTISIILGFLPTGFLGVRLFAAPFIAFEGKIYGIGALKESFKRTDGYFYQIAVLMLLTFVVSTVIVGILYLISILFIAMLSHIAGTKEQYTILEIFLKFRLFLFSQKSWLILVGSWFMWTVKFISPAFAILTFAEIYSRISIPDVAIIHKENHYN